MPFSVEGRPSPRHIVRPGGTGSVYMAIIIGAFGLGIATYAAMETDPEQVKRRALYGIGGLVIFITAVLVL